MSINLNVPTNEMHELKPRLTVIGVGGAGGNAVNNMIRSQLVGMDFIVANTDAQALSLADTDRRIQLGSTLTQGLGAGARPDVGRAAAEEAIDDIIGHLKGTHMTFIAAGMGGGTGTGSAPIIAQAARDLGILTVGVVTKPFQFEGAHRMRIAEEGIKELEQYVDTLIIIPNQNLFRVANEKTTFADAFKMADDVLYSGVRGVTDLMVMPGLINLDFADVRSVMSEMGKAMMGTGEAEGERRALDAAEAAISNPLLDDTSMKGAKGILINITGGMDMTLFEVDEAANRIRAEAGEDAYIIFGSTFDESLEGTMRVSVVATGIDAESMARPKPRLLNLDEDEAILPQVEIMDEPAPQREPAPIFTKAADASPTMASAGAEKLASSLSPESMIIPPEAPAPEADMDLDSAAIGEEAIVADVEPTTEAAFDEAAPDMVSPPATPGMGNEDAYIPPPAMERNGDVAPSEAEPFAEADMANAAKASAPPSKKSGGRRLSLFSLATGVVGRSAKPAPEAIRVEPEISQKPTDSQPELGSMEPADRLPTTQAEEDLLDIPAFLRRQAN